ncbi:MAG TPA: hypothetical protein VGM31_00565, partial [Puia sp.]
MTRYLFQLTVTVILTAAMVGFGLTVSAQQPTDTARQRLDSIRRADSLRHLPDTAHPGADSLKFPLYDRRSDRFTSPNRNPFDLKDPANIHDSIEYDPVTRQYYIVE